MTTDSLDAFRDSARDFLSRKDQLKRLRALGDNPQSVDRAVWREMADMGWLAILVPEAEGGLGLGLREVAVIAEECGQQLLPEPFIAAAVQVTTVLCQISDSELKATLLPKLLDGALIIGLAWQERLGQLDPDSTLTSAIENGEGFSLNGRKLFVTPGSDADGWIVSADCDGTLKLFWIPAATPGLRLVDAVRVDGNVMCEMTLDGVDLSSANVLASGAAAHNALSVANDAARIAQGAELLGVMRRALAITIDYLNTRQQFGKLIGSFQALKHRAVDGYVQTELAASCLADVLTALDQGHVPRGILASRVKARCAHAALLVTRMAIQLHGAMGYTDECDIGLYLKRALHLSAWLGNASANRQRYSALQPRFTDAVESVAAPSLIRDFPHDADWDAMPEAEFRALVRGFFAQHYPEQLRNMPSRMHWNEMKDWYMTLSRQGWVAPSWPKKFGGMGLAPDKMLAWVDEQEQYGVARSPDMGIVMIGPLLIQRGNAAQQAQFLPKILSGENVWCQGYSEPGAGSDLASLRTEALIDGDEFIVTGNKTWATLAQDATHMFTLVRTDKTAKKQAGISFLLIDLDTPGVTIRPIKDIGGHEDFCEVFLDQVRVPLANLVGELNQGWGIAKALLGFERIFLGSPKQSQYALAQLTALADARGLFAGPAASAFMARYTELQLDVADLCAAYAHFADVVKRGEALPPGVSLLKIWGSETYQKICMMLVEAADEYGGSAIAADFGGLKLDVVSMLFTSTPATIYGGSSEIQRDIIAKNVLRLPD
ncbi:acyl-CoA dehydrogenase [Glaciimonas sp. Gout2]|uniref:acyl-CoA dehydrogenase n=1 Tax=unclassified Glaciimonas TaxID=2644401 RepID=UPI002B227449|nr:MULTISPECIES: acyl-CoA dehydrogenase [unclassified Glaciimonas]MEB0010179.1 acyl-CoA dehydrogenase [Glaciimonas sp. Cout2]MEB0084316.1 acyl-CoA dehydrogenase [Glaciimonas sp. Gout2]